MKKLSDIKDKNELKKILDKSELYFNIENLCQSYNIDYVNEILDCFNSHYIDYKFIDHYGQPMLSYFTYVSSNGEGGFIDGLETLQSEYSFFSDAMLKKLDKVIEIYDNYDWEDEEYDDIYVYLDEITDYMEDAINELLVVPPEAVYEEFYNIVDSYDDLYVDDDGDIVDEDGDLYHC